MQKVSIHTEMPKSNSSVTKINCQDIIVCIKASRLGKIQPTSYQSDWVVQRKALPNIGYLTYAQLTQTPSI